jgi:hypothetical protein
MLNALRPPPKKIGNTFKISVRMTHPTVMMPAVKSKQTKPKQKLKPKSAGRRKSSKRKTSTRRRLKK